MGFQKATRRGKKLRLAITGPSGSGKTLSALKIAAALVPGGRIAVVDTENDSAALYADVIEFDSDPIDSFEPQTYVEKIREAVEGGYDVVILDSLSHAWMGTGGILDQLDKAKRNFNAWATLSPQQTALIDAIIRAPIHIIATMRSKTEYVVEKDSNGKSTPRKVGMAPIQRDGTEYEFTAVLDLDLDHVASVSKTRCSGLDGKSFRKPGADVAKILRDWLDGAAPATPRDAQPAAATPPALASFYTGAEQIELPGEAVALWIKHRAGLAALSSADREAAWTVLCKRTEEVGKMKNAKVWLKRAIAEEDARRGDRRPGEVTYDERAERDYVVGGPSPETLARRAAANAWQDNARAAFSAAADARALLALAPKVVGAAEKYRAETAALYRDRWVEYVASLAPETRKRAMRVVGELPAPLMALADWKPLTDLFAGDEPAPAASQGPPAADAARDITPDDLEAGPALDEADYPLIDDAPRDGGDGDDDAGLPPATERATDASAPPDPTDY